MKIRKEETTTCSIGLRWEKEGEDNMVTLANSATGGHAKRPLESPWRQRTGSLTAARDLELVLTPNARIPLKYWRRNFWFVGAGDERLHSLTGGEFSREIVPDHTHPLFAVRVLEHGIGCTVCPCSSQTPYQASAYRFIRQGCVLLHTGHVMDRNSYLIEGLAFSVPASMAGEVAFKGEVPEPCISGEKKRR